MKPWPEKGMVSFEETIRHIRDLLEQAYTLKRTPKRKFSYEGYDQGSIARAGLPPFDELLNAEGQAYVREHGRDLLDTILNMTWILGMEQGKRQAEEDMKIKLLLEYYRGKEDARKEK